MSSNPGGTTTTVKHQLALCLLKNMEILKNNQVQIKASWIDLKQIDVLDDELNGFMVGFSFAEEQSSLSRDGNKEVQLVN